MAKRWQQHQDGFLRDRYAGGASLATIAHRLTRSEDAVDARRGLSAGDVAARLGRPPTQVLQCRRELGLGRLRSRPYTSADDTAIRAAWSDGADLEALGHQLERTPEALRLRAHALGFHRPPERRRWTAEEDTILRDGYTSALSCPQIASLLMRRTP